MICVEARRSTLRSITQPQHTQWQPRLCRPIPWLQREPGKPGHFCHPRRCRDRRAKSHRRSELRTVPRGHLYTQGGACCVDFIRGWDARGTCGRTWGQPGDGRCWRRGGCTSHKKMPQPAWCSPRTWPLPGDTGKRGKGPTRGKRKGQGQKADDKRSAAPPCEARVPWRRFSSCARSPTRATRTCHPRACAGCKWCHRAWCGHQALRQSGAPRSWGRRHAWRAHT